MATPLDAGSRLTAIFRGSAGNLVEYYDWYVYTAFSLYFASVFFPKGDQTAQLLSTAAVFAVGFLMRPFGALLFGRYADRAGRRAALVSSVTLMCAGSLLVAITPGYETIGVFAPAMLLFARLLQGLSLGGEYGTSSTYLSEIANTEHRGFWVSFQYVSLVIGQLLALCMLLLLQHVFLTEAELQSWGWRIPFFVGAACAAYALYLRRHMPETDSFEQQTTAKRMQGSVLELLRHPRAFFLVIAISMGGNVTYYTFATYMQLFLVNTSGMSKETATLINASTLFLFMLMQPIVGSLSDRVGRRPVLITFGVLGTACTIPIMHAIEATTSAWTAFWLVLAALGISSFYSSISALVKAELFPVHIRALGVGLPHSIAVSLFGGTASLIALWLKDRGMEGVFYWYVSGCVACSLLTYLLMRDTREHSLIDRDAAVAAAAKIAEPEVPIEPDLEMPIAPSGARRQETST